MHFNNIFIFVLTLLIVKVNCFDIMNFFSSTSTYEINTDEIRQYIIREIENNKRTYQNDKMKHIVEKEKKLKDELVKKITENVKKQIKIEEENSKYVKYFEIVKEKNRKENDESEEEEILKFVEQNLNIRE
jgi:hypothetical protein